MSDVSPLPYASPDLPEARLAAGVRRAVAWVAMAYGVVGVIDSIFDVAFFVSVPGAGRVSMGDYAMVSAVYAPGALLKALFALAGWMLLMRIRGGMKLLRMSCWILIVAPVLVSLVASLLVQRSSQNSVILATLSSFLSSVSSAALPGLILMLPMRRDEEA